MAVVSQGSPQFITLQAGETLTVTADALSHGLVRRRNDNYVSGGQLTGRQEQDVPASSTRIFGPFPTNRHYSIEVAVGQFTYTVAQHQFGYAVNLGNVEAFTGSRILRTDDNGKLLRCDDGGAVVLTVPNDLPEGFNVAFAQWAAGSVTITAASGATNRSSTVAVSAQYAVGSLIVLKNADGVSAEFVLGGNVA